MFKDEKIYIAGPECFYTGGYEMLGAMRKYAESKGFGVTGVQTCALPIYPKGLE